MSAVIETDSIVKRYGSLTALDGVTMRVEKGELFGLIGPDGAGKSSLYRILATLACPDAGAARVLGADTVAGADELRLRLGYMPERFALYPDLTVEENLNFFANLFGVSIKDNYDIIEPVYRQLSRFPKRPAGKLSGGMKQKLALSCALIHRPDLLLLDEPTTGVDAVSREEFWQTLRMLTEGGLTVMVSTSYMDEATLCDRIAMIDRGRILMTDSPGRLAASAGERLFAARATDMYGLLEALRTLPSVENCYTFGSTLHIVGAAGFTAGEAAAEMRRRGFHDVSITPAEGTVEDLFIKLSEHDN